jgi:hypothetical protein
MNTISTTVSNPSATDTADSTPVFVDILESSLIDGKRVTLPDLAAQCGKSTASMKKALKDYYGVRVTFMRGRTGGIRIDGVTAEKEDSNA